MIRVLIGSPICQIPQTLKEFLISLKEIILEDIQLDYYFVDDNTDPVSSLVLNQFKEENKNALVEEGNNTIEYVCDEYTHRWNQPLIEKITKFKNGIIQYALDKKYDYLFLIDSDIVLNPKTLTRLISLKKEIVSNIFWTQWNPQIEELPQVWMKDEYTLYDAMSNSGITENEAAIKTREFINMLRKPGTYKVGGLGACTLISRKALEKGVNFNPVYNISFWGEDRHFCIRAAVLGIQLYVDTYYPAFHIYRPSDIEKVAEYKQNCAKRETEILGAQVLDLIVKGLEDYGNYSYKKENQYDWKKYFTKSEGDRLEDLLKKNRLEVITNTVINKIQVMECQITFYNENTKVLAKVKFNEQGYKHSYTFYDEFEANVVVLRQEDDSWLIDKYEVDKKLILDFIPLIRRSKEKNNKLTLSMIVKDEEDRYLERVLKSNREFIDNAVIIDDGSTDKTVEICRELLKDIPLTLIENKNSKFSNEVELRKQQWYETIATNPDWILFLDADEVFEDKFKDHVRELMENVETDSYIFRLYDFWDEEHYRNDGLWFAHNTYRPFMIRYQKNFKYTFKETNQHCGRMPENVLQLPYAKSELRLKHYGWSRVNDRIKKYARYMVLDPEGRTGSLEQYKSILDVNPRLAKWNENE